MDGTISSRMYSPNTLKLGQTWLRLKRDSPEGPPALMTHKVRTWNDKQLRSEGFDGVMLGIRNKKKFKCPAERAFGVSLTPTSHGNANTLSTMR